jgi:hypothetical protein
VPSFSHVETGVWYRLGRLIVLSDPIGDHQALRDGVDGWSDSVQPHVQL